MKWLRDWIETHGEWSRKRLARELCLEWDWRNERGALKDFAARSFLLKLESWGQVRLPALQVQKRRPARAVPALAGWREPELRQESLRELQPVQLEVVRAGTERYKRWAFHLDRYHYLGLRVVGENLGFAVYDRQGQDLGCLLFGAPAWRCQVRDRFLNWSPAERAAQLPRLANNTRFLILPWVRAPHLASYVLGQVARRISSDWQHKYGHGLRWLESFVDTERYGGTCYRAANWRYLGLTMGRSRQDRHHRLSVSAKAVYLFDLSRR
ncbi:MAG: DUF4338 domain-containing protein [Verrucomicrobia bacterium]|nr:DUF4338 domain-containing protein [Verrucomicrobiota bacterium]